ncbi:hypothetical protein Y032_0552g3334 [Ancylostoma ceylanicum]|uniref:Uncharacterized protein n=1 Tax=Ancylostoma ceylanicum TaxID=53326 RepID=A0A016WS55_9BILA|nr:hypothetical protein Y032_0552g3334 [Ancylostoma ceylanicum]
MTSLVDIFGSSAEVPWSFRINEAVRETSEPPRSYIFPCEHVRTNSQQVVQSEASELANLYEAIRTSLLRTHGSSEFSSVLYATMMRGPLPSAAVEETLRSCMNQPSVFDSSKMVRLVQVAEEARYGGVMEITEALRMLVETVISQNVEENLLLIQLRDLGNEVLHLSGAICRVKNASTYDVSLRYENITSLYVANVGGPFKQIDLKDELCRYKASARAKKSVSATIVGFYRHIFEQLCFAISDFTLDALGLARPELSSSVNVQQFRGTNDSFWITLGASDEIREEKFRSLMEVKATSTVDSNVAMAEALYVIVILHFLLTGAPSGR